MSHGINTRISNILITTRPHHHHIQHHQSTTKHHFTASSSIQSSSRWSTNMATNTAFPKNIAFTGQPPDHMPICDILPRSPPTRHGAWLPADHRIQHEWIQRQIKHVDSRSGPTKLSPVIQGFKDFIEGNPRIYMYFTSMWDEVPRKKPYDKDPTGTMRQIRDYQHMLELLNHIFGRAPEWADAAAGVGMVGVPMVSVFD
jgi:hypothetical protein